MNAFPRSDVISRFIRPLLLLITISGWSSARNGNVWFYFFLAWCWFGLLLDVPTSPPVAGTEQMIVIGTYALALIFTISGCISMIIFLAGDNYRNELFPVMIVMQFVVILCIGLRMNDLHSVSNSSHGLTAPEDDNLERIDTQPSSPKGGADQSFPTKATMIGKVLSKVSAVQTFLLIAITITSGLGCVVTASMANSNPASGKLFDIGNKGYDEGIYKSRRLHIVCSGDVSPTDPNLEVVMFEHGWSGSSMDWSLVSYEVKAYTRVCAYDRSGYGWSDRGPSPRTNIWQAPTQNRKLLLVGHSMAGLQMRIFQDRNPDMVSGIVFGDAVNPKYIDYPGFGNRRPYLLWNTLGANLLVPSGLFSILVGTFNTIVPHTAGVNPDAPENKEYPDFNSRYSYIVSSSKWYENSAEEYQAWPENAARVLECGVNKDGQLGDLPIWVFSARDTEVFDDYRWALELETLSTNSQSRVVEDAVHGFNFNYEHTPMFVDAILGMLGLTPA